MEEETAPQRIIQSLRLGGYLIAGGALLGFSVGIYFLYDRLLFASVLQIAQHEVTGYFLSVFMPSFLILIAAGYYVATSSLKRVTLSNIASSCLISVICISLSVLSSLFLVSSVGGFLILMVLVRGYAKPAFRTLSRKESLFLVQMGALLLASFALLFLLMDLVRSFVETYRLVSYSADSMIVVVALSFLMFFAVPILNAKSTSSGLNAVFCFVLSVLAFMFVLQSRYVFFNLAAVVGLFMMIGGFVFVVFGNLVNVWVFVSELAVPEPEIVKTYSLLRRGRYCPYCGKPRATDVQDSCSYCRRSLTWSPFAPFCSSCGHLVPSTAQVCPHCKEDIESKRVMFDLKSAEEQDASGRAVAESLSGMKQSWLKAGALEIPRVLVRVGRILWSIPGFVGGVIDRSTLTLKEGVYALILTGLFAFLGFVVYPPRVEPPTMIFPNVPVLVQNYGFPIVWLRVFLFLPHPDVYKISILWVELFVDLVLFFLAGLGIVFLVTRVVRAPRKPELSRLRERRVEKPGVS